MCSRVVRGVIALVACGCAETSLPAPEPPASSPDMPAQVQALLERRCAGCHRAGPGDKGGWGSVLDVPGMIEARVVVPGEPRASSLIGQLTAGEMPKRGPRLSPREVQLLEQWIGGLAVRVARSQ
jgi:mono/diheme cytochrome c family protein